MDLIVWSFHLKYLFQSESLFYSCLNVKEILARQRPAIWNLSDCNWNRTNNHLLRKLTLSHLAKLTKWLSWVVSTYLYGAFDSIIFSCYVLVSSESTHFSCLNVKELLPQNILKILISSDCNWTPTHNDLVLKWTINYFTKLNKSLSWVVTQARNHLNFRYRACFEKGVPWHSGNYRV